MTEDRRSRPRRGFALGLLHVGALGSRKTHGRRLERLAEAGFDATATDRIHAPIGLDIGAVSPAEIALAILAEIVQTRAARAASRPEADNEIRTRPSPTLSAHRGTYHPCRCDHREEGATVTANWPPSLRAAGVAEIVAVRLARRYR
jgi:hypothetical protein